MAQGKSPYEIRADLLRLAFDILQVKASVEESGIAPTAEEVIAEAKKLNEFVSNEKTNFRN